MAVKLFLLVIGCMTKLVAAAYFEDCGGQGFVVNDVEVEGCSCSPCTINVGNSVTVAVNSVNEVTNFITLHSAAYISTMGFSWRLHVTPEDICQNWGCPFSDSSTRSFSGSVYFNSTLLRRPSSLTVTATYETESDEQIGFCIRVPVVLV